MGIWLALHISSVNVCMYVCVCVYLDIWLALHISSVNVCMYVCVCVCIWTFDWLFTRTTPSKYSSYISCVCACKTKMDTYIQKLLHSRQHDPGKYTDRQTDSYTDGHVDRQTDYLTRSYPGVLLCPVEHGCWFFQSCIDLTLVACAFRQLCLCHGHCHRVSMYLMSIYMCLSMCVTMCASVCVQSCIGFPLVACAFRQLCLCHGQAIE
jgi:hypothetical protein